MLISQPTNKFMLVLLVTTSLLVPTAHGRETVVKPGDTLWSIAKHSLASESTTVAQQAIAILNLNPTAFTGGNMNRMLHGAMLKLPTEQQVEAIDSRHASKMAHWRKGTKPDALDSQTVTVIRGSSIEEIKIPL